MQELFRAVLYRARAGARADSLHNSFHGSTGLAQAPYKNRAGPAQEPCGPCTVPVQNRGTYMSQLSFEVLNVRGKKVCPKVQEMLDISLKF